MVASVSEPKIRKRSRLRRFVKWMILILLILFLVFIFGVIPFLLSWGLTRAGTGPTDQNLPDDPAAYGANNFEAVTFPSTDGVPLSAWYLPGEHKGINLILGHGRFRSRKETMERGVRLWERGYGVLLLDFRRHGQSGGEITTMGYKERLDYLGGMNYLQQRQPEAKVAFMGVSMGAAAALMAAAETDQVAAVIAESPFLSFNDVIDHHFKLYLPRFPWYAQPLRLVRWPIQKKFIWLTEWRGDFDAEAFDVEQATRQIKAPILFIVGRADERMPPAVSEQLYQVAAHPHKQLWIVESKGTGEKEVASHGHAFRVEPEGYIARIDMFLTGLEP